jgi:hypothetical protein
MARIALTGSGDPVESRGPDTGRAYCGRCNRDHEFRLVVPPLRTLRDTAGRPIGTVIPNASTLRHFDHAHRKFGVYNRVENRTIWKPCGHVLCPTPERCIL